MNKISHENFLDLFLKDLKLKYDTETKREALMEYAKDLSQAMAEEANRQGKTKEEFIEELHQEMRASELKRLRNPEMSATYQKILMMFKDWDGED